MKLLILLPILMVTGCATRVGTHQEMTHPDKTVTVPTRHAYLGASDARRVRNPEFVKSYYVGRRHSKNGSRMHEAHRVYQVEKSNRWNLLRNNPPLQSSGPVRVIADSAFRPLPKSNQMRAETARQQEITHELQAARDQTLDQLGQMKARLSEQGGHVKTIEELRQRLVEERRARLTLERKLQIKDTSANDTSNDSASKAEALREWGNEQP